MNKKTRFIFLFLFFYSFLVLPQSSRISESRISKYLSSNNNLNMVTATDHLPLFLFNPLDHWSASKAELLIDGISFNEFPFNFKSPNLMPIDFPYVKEIRQTMIPQMKYFSAAAKGFIEVNEYKDLQDSLVFKLHSYIGSETGDPLIHVFTKENIEQSNKNKIPLSGSLSASNKTSDFSYKLSLGNYGSFSTGSVNDQIIFNKSNYFFGKQNKQLFGSFGLKYNEENKREYTLSASAISYYGWDVPPFISTFIHFETYLYTLRASVKNLADGFSLFIINDGSLTEVHKLRGIPATKFYLSKYTLFSKYEFEIRNLLFEISSDITYNTAANLNTQDTLSIKFFKDEPEQTSFGINFSSFFPWKENIFIQLKVRLDSNNKTKAALSGNIDLGFALSKDNLIAVKISSVTASPNLTELFGAFLLNDFGTSDSFTISGNKHLLSERNNHIGLQYSGTFLKRLSLSVELFAEKSDHPIRQKTERTIINKFGELYRDGYYINTSSKKAVGANILFQYNLNDLNFISSFIFTDNAEIPYYPRHLVFAKTTLKLPINSDIQLKFNYSSKTSWEEFFVAKENDRLRSLGSTGVLKENYSFDFAYYQNLTKIYFLKNLVLGFTIQNIFNNKIKFLPIGNFLERAIIFSLYSEI